MIDITRRHFAVAITASLLAPRAFGQTRPEIALFKDQATDAVASSLAAETRHRQHLRPRQ